MMKRFGVYCVMVLAWTIVARAIPAFPGARTFVQPDGTTITLQTCGDEWCHWTTTADGYTVMQDERGFMTYARVDGDRLVPTEVVAHDRRTAVEEAFLATMSKNLLPEGAVAAGRRTGCAARETLSPRRATDWSNYRGLVVLVNFTDSVFSVGQTDEEIRSYYDLFCNGTRDGELYKGHGSYGSVRDYFVQQSGGIFQPEFTIIGPVTLPNPESTYGKNGSSSKDTGYSDFRKDAVSEATQIYEGDWMDFDNKGKGQVDMVFYVYAGCGENSGAAETTIWPKESTASTTVNGIKFATTGCTSESSLVYGRVGNEVVPVRTVPDGIGVFCHELSHALGLPDFYDTSYKAFGMDLWSIMDYGCYGNNGYTPGSYTAYERDYMGWRSLVTLGDSCCDLILQPTEAGGVGYKIVNDENPDEYYIIENRQSVGWDETIGRMGHGLQVTHVDFSASAWRSNTVNTTANHQRMTIFAANNRYVGTSISGDFSEWRETWSGNLYPYKMSAWEYNDSLTANSIPAATVYTASGFMNKNLNAIKELEDGSVSLHYGNDYDVVGIRQLASDERRKTQEVYDLAGRRLGGQPATLKPGIYVVGGRKRVVR